MLYRDYQGEKLSLLGFGAMRLPLEPDRKGIDEAQTARMVAYAIEHGVNYFDTAYPYHDGRSELVIGKLLQRYPRHTYNLATKYPGHQICDTYNPAAIFEEQLVKCGVDYFDFYLLHNIYENSIDTYLDSRWKIPEYFIEQKRLGRIRHLGFSCHGGPELLRRFLDCYGGEMEFCQLQLNYLDWQLQQGKVKYQLLRERNIPVWVMEPVRGGQLAHLSEEASAKLKLLRPEESDAAWAFRWLQELPEVRMILSGMSDLAQMRENIETFREEKPLSGEERQVLEQIAAGLYDRIPCTACRYCCDSCPMELDIPMLLDYYNEIRFSPSVNTAMRLDALPEGKFPSACIGCGACAVRCPQKIEIPKLLGEFAEALKKIPKWADICREREAVAARLREGR